MSILALQPGRFSSPKPRTLEVTTIPAPFRGVDTRVGLRSSPDASIYSYNLIPSEDGLRVRKGHREWQIDVNSTISDGINTILPYDNSDSSTLTDKLFVTTREGIWDVTADGGTPVLVLAFTDTSITAGYGPFTHYVDAAGTELMLYADSINGLFTYDPAAGTWAQTAGITGPVIANVRWVVVHKQRIWLIEENSTSAWYLPVSSIAGAATEFVFGSKLPHGGALVGLFNWTVDGGAGVDDFLVAVSRAGDVLPYQGEDPATATTWGLRGTYYIGEVPPGAEFATSTGGELYLLSVNGVTGMGALLRGVDSLIGLNTGGSIDTDSITSIIRKEMLKSVSSLGWSIKLIPQEAGLLISAPTTGSDPDIQFFYNFAAKGWGVWRGVPVRSIGTWNIKTIIGDDTNRVMAMDVTVDNAQITPPTGKPNGDDIEFSILTTFQDLGKPGLYKRVKIIRPDFVAQIKPAHTSVARYDYNFGEAALNPVASSNGSGLWDTGFWDTAVWGSDTFNNYSPAAGSWGHGRNVAIATKGKTRTELLLVGWQVLFNSGGPMI